MAYNAVLWTAKTPITYDKLAQMQENIEVLRSLIEGNDAYTEGTPMGAGRGILHLQEITSTVISPKDSVVDFGNPFTPKTEAGRRYLFEVYVPRVYSGSGWVGFILYKGNEEIHQFGVGPAAEANASYLLNFPQPQYADSGYGAVHLVPGFSTTAEYRVRTIAWGNYTDGKIYGDSKSQSFIKFTDVGPAYS